jgi:pimeloyl-ACP methyl ester carboxylesterase
VKKPIAIVAAFIGMIAAFVAGLRMLVRRREDVSWSEAAQPGRYIDVEGVQVHYVENSPQNITNAPVIVMIHGFGGNTFSFRHQLAAFGSDYRCVAIDLKGFGYTQRPEGGDYSLTAQAGLMLGAMDVLGIERATLIGHSMGGEVVMRMAEQAPERVEKLILAASVPGDRLPTLPRIGLMKPVAMATARVVGLAAWRRMFYDRTKLDTRAIRKAYIAPYRIEGTQDALWEMYADTRKDRKIAYERITAPVLILWAEREKILPFASRSLKLLQKHFPEAEIVPVPYTGHLLLEENPAAANAAIRTFLGAPDRSAGSVETLVTPA